MNAIFRVLIGVWAVSLSLVLAGPAASARTVAVPNSAAAAVGLTASAVPAVGTWPVLRQGATNTAVTVRLLQYLLNAHGAGLTVDGIFVARTTSAVRDHQARHGLAVDGIVGPRTWSSLLGDRTPGQRGVGGEGVPGSDERTQHRGRRGGVPRR